MDEGAYTRLKKQAEENKESVEKLKKKLKQITDEKFLLEEELRRCEAQADAVAKEKAEKNRPKDPRKKLRDTDPNLVDRKDPRKAKELQDLVQNQLNQLMRGKGAEVDLELGESRVKVVRIKYLPGVKDGEVEKYERIEPLEAEFKLTHKSTFRTLKETACGFWDLHELGKYELRAENMAILDVNPNEKVEDVLADNGMSQEMWLFEKFTKAVFLLPPMENYFIDQNTSMKFAKDTGQAQPRQRKANLGLSDAQHAENFKILKKMFLGLNTYQTAEEAYEQRRVRQAYDSTCCTLLFLLIFLVLNLYSLEARRSPSEAFSEQTGAHIDINTQYAFGDKFLTISTEQNLNDFFEIAFPMYMFAKVQENTVYPSYRNINEIRIRQVRTKQRECPYTSDLPLQSFPCYYSTYSESTKETARIADLEEAWTYYNSSSETDVQYSYEGEFSTYDGSGYTLKVPYTMDSDDFTSLYQHILEKGWISPATRAIFLTYTKYLPSADAWMDIFAAVEISVTGTYLARTATADFMVADVNSISKSTPRRVEVIRIILSLYFLVLYILRVLIMEDGRRNFQYLVSFYGLLDLLSMITIIIGASCNLAISVDPTSAFDDNVFTDFSNAFSAYKVGTVFNCYSLVLIFFQILRFMRFYMPIDFALTIFEAASANIMYFFLLLVPILIGFILLSMNIWGPYLDSYHTVEQSTLSLVFLILGKFDTLLLMEIDQGWTVGFILLFFLFILFFLASFYGAFYMDAYRIVRIYWNFGSMMKETGQKVPLEVRLKTIRDWLFAWVPEKIKKKFSEKPKDPPKPSQA